MTALERSGSVKTAGDVRLAAFSPDGRTLASGSVDGLLKLWDLPMIHRELAAMGLDW